MSEDPQKIWSEHYERIKKRRLKEASILSSIMQKSSVTEKTILALDFIHFASDKKDAKSLSDQLSENYNVKIQPASQEGYWLIICTTRPEGITLSAEQHISWVEFMCDVAHSHACVFSTWIFEEPSMGKAFASEDIETKD